MELREYIDNNLMTLYIITLQIYKNIIDHISFHMLSDATCESNWRNYFECKKLSHDFAAIRLKND